MPNLLQLVKGTEQVLPVAMIRYMDESVTMTEEVWKDITGWPFNQISNHGRVRALPGGTIGRRPVYVTELRKLTRSNAGYIRIMQGKRDRLVHRLVLEAFVGPCPPGQECRHLNGNPADNRWPENLDWGPPKINQEDRIRHGTDNFGERNGLAKLSDSAVNDIINNPGPDWEKAKKYNVHPNTIYRVRTGRAWKQHQSDA